MEKSIDDMIKSHQDALAQPRMDIIARCFESYGNYLAELETFDTNNLKRWLGELRAKKRGLLRDLEQSKEDKNQLLRDREDLLIEGQRPHDGGNLRMRVEGQLEEINDARDLLTVHLTEEEKQENADECAKGFDKIY